MNCAICTKELLRGQPWTHSQHEGKMSPVHYTCIRVDTATGCTICKEPITDDRWQWIEHWNQASGYPKKLYYERAHLACLQRGAAIPTPDPTDPTPDPTHPTSISTTIFSSGAISSKIPRYELIPPSALRALARRMERGLRVKGLGAWNALSNQAPALDRQFVIDRLSHCIDHCYKAISRLSGTKPPLDAGDTYDGGDAGAIMFAGALLIEHLDKTINKPEDEKK